METNLEGERQLPEDKEPVAVLENVVSGVEEEGESEEGESETIEVQPEPEDDISQEEGNENEKEENDVESVEVIPEKESIDEEKIGKGEKEMESVEANPVSEEQVETENENKGGVDKAEENEEEDKGEEDEGEDGKEEKKEDEEKGGEENENSIPVEESPGKEKSEEKTKSKEKKPVVRKRFRKKSSKTNVVGKKQPKRKKKKLSNTLRERLLRKMELPGYQRKAGFKSSSLRFSKQKVVTDQHVYCSDYSSLEKSPKFTRSLPSCFFASKTKRGIHDYQWTMGKDSPAPNSYYQDKSFAKLSDIGKKGHHPSSCFASGSPRFRKKRALTPGPGECFKTETQKLRGRPEGVFASRTERFPSRKASYNAEVGSYCITPKESEKKVSSGMFKSKTKRLMVKGAQSAVSQHIVDDEGKVIVRQRIESTRAPGDYNYEQYSEFRGKKGDWKKTPMEQHCAFGTDERFKKQSFLKSFMHEIV